MHGNAMATASAANTMQQGTPFLLTLQIRTVTAMYDYLPDNNTPIEKLISDRILLEQLFARLRELDPEANTIIQLWMDHPEGISDRAIARELGRPQKTFADQMKKYRIDLRRITGDK
jgi:hypothetical protein